MKVIIAGGRDYHLTSTDHVRLDEMREQLPITEVVSRCARGADASALDWAVLRGVPTTRFSNGWDRLATSGSTQLPAEMTDYAEALIVFPGGTGTSAVVMQAQASGLSVIDWRLSKLPRQLRKPHALDRLIGRVKTWVRRKRDERRSAATQPLPPRSGRGVHDDRREPIL